MERFSVICIGGGFSGLGVGAALKRAGRDDFLILEKAERLGGTWRDNTYPGCACDVPSALYSFSFAPNPGWSRVFAPQAEIQAYLLDVARQTGVHAHVRTGTEVLEARWLDTERVWEVRTNQGVMRASVLVSAAGPLHEPRIPAFAGLADFEGTVFHSARWRHDHELSGRRVAVVGTGSSAVQLVPEIQPEVEHLTLFQRTPGWVLPKPDHAIPPIERAAFEGLPGFGQLYRGAWYYGLELLQLAQRRPAVMARLQALALLHLRRQVRDPMLRDALTPEWVLGCKRLLLSNTYYPALQQPNVTLTGAVRSLTAGGVVDASGVEHAVDTVILATGFHVSDPPIAERLVGRSGQTLAEQWGGSPSAYLGTTVPDFPNLFLMLGPNLGNGHSSALVLIEAQAEHLVRALDHMERRGIDTIEVREPVHDTYNEAVQDALAGTVWNAGGCASWYLDETGTNSAIYPWSTVDLRRRLGRFEPRHFVCRGGPVVAITGGARGIGRATAEAFVAAGARVCLGDLDEVAARRTADALGAKAYPLDVTDSESVEAFVAAVEEDVGPIAVWVNNAGVLFTGAMLDQSDEQLDLTMDVNYAGTLRGLRAVLPGMVERGRGHVVNVASLGGRIAVAGMGAYVASKHAVVGLSTATRLELEGTGVTLTTVLPTAVHTRLASGLPVRGLSAVPPDAVADAIVASVQRPEAEVVVPRRLDLPTRLIQALPESLVDRLRRLLDAGRLMGHRDPPGRVAYEAEALRRGVEEAS